MGTRSTRVRVKDSVHPNALRELFLVRARSVFGRGVCPGFTLVSGIFAPHWPQNFAPELTGLWHEGQSTCPATSLAAGSPYRGSGEVISVSRDTRFPAGSYPKPDLHRQTFPGNMDYPVSFVILVLSCYIDWGFFFFHIRSSSRSWRRIAYVIGIRTRLDHLVELSGFRLTCIIRYQGGTRFDGCYRLAGG